MHLGCYHCLDTIESWDEVNAAFGIAAPQLPGYVGLIYWDEEGPYICIGRCFYCNHRDH